MESEQKRGRPKSPNRKTEAIHVRVDKETMKLLTDYCVRNNVERTEAIRRGIHKIAEED